DYLLREHIRHRPVPELAAATRHFTEIPPATIEDQRRRRVRQQPSLQRMEERRSEREHEHRRERELRSPPTKPCSHSLHPLTSRSRPSPRSAFHLRGRGLPRGTSAPPTAQDG